MRMPPSPRFLLDYPVTGGIAILALCTTLLWWLKYDQATLFMSYQAWQGQPWRLLTSALPHVDAFHLAFNLYWLWVFGTLIEEVYGHWKTGLLMLFLAAVSGAAEYAIMAGGVGLSGVGYGLFGLVWVLGRLDERFRDGVDQRTALIFVLWFFLCCVLTYLDIWRVGNIAHLAGGVFGALVGLAIGWRGMRRVAIVGAVLGLAVLVFLGASVGRPYVNLSRDAGKEYAYRGYLELKDGHDEEAVRFYLVALRLDDRKASWWYNLGIAYEGLHEAERAQGAFERAAQLEPNDEQYRHAVDSYRQPIRKW